MSELHRHSLEIPNLRYCLTNRYNIYLVCLEMNILSFQKIWGCCFFFLFSVWLQSLISTFRLRVGSVHSLLMARSCSDPFRYMNWDRGWRNLVWRFTQGAPSLFLKESHNIKSKSHIPVFGCFSISCAVLRKKPTDC